MFEITFVLDHCNDAVCGLESGGDDWVWIVVVRCDACLFLFNAAAEDEEGPETLGVDRAVMVGLAGVVVDNLPVLDEYSSVFEAFLAPVKEEVVEAAPNEDRRELALLFVVPSLRVDDIIRQNFFCQSF